MAALLKDAAAEGPHVHLMFQDEARFGRMVRIRRSWVPTPERPVVSIGYKREFVYVYGAISPVEGEFDWMVCRKMNTEQMTSFLGQVSAPHPDEFLLMVVDRASSHVAKELVVPENIPLLCLPPYAPELNPQEHIWDGLREKSFPNRVFATLDAVLEQLNAGLIRLAADTDTLRSIAGWSWIVSINLNAF
jgi:hypothetical protein